MTSLKTVFPKCNMAMFVLTTSTGPSQFFIQNYYPIRQGTGQHLVCTFHFRLGDYDWTNNSTECTGCVFCQWYQHRRVCVFIKTVAFSLFSILDTHFSIALHNLMGALYPFYHRTSTREFLMTVTD